MVTERTVAALFGVLILCCAACGGDGAGAGASLSARDFCTEVADAYSAALDASHPDDFDDAIAEMRNAVAEAPSDELREAGKSLADAGTELLNSGEGAGAQSRLDAAEEARNALDALCDDHSSDETPAAGEDDPVEAQIDRAIDEAVKRLDAQGLDQMDIATATEILENLAADEIVGLDSQQLEELLGDASDLLDGLDLGGRGGPQSGMDDEFAQCNSDLEADAPGDNAGCDALYDACESGDSAACNDLWKIAPIGSVYAAFAESCGGRADEPAFGTCGG